jgi:DNA-binding transcriptional ArsR family regulator
MDKINPNIVKFFEALSDETRLKILVSISEEPLTVNKIHEKVPALTLSAVSHQLKYMSQMHIIESERRGRNKYFRLSHRFCWCILRDAFAYFRGRTRCRGCAKIEKVGGLLRKRRTK